MDFISGFDRGQLVMMDFESCLGPDSWARTVDMFIDILPVAELGFKDVLNSEGRPPYRSSVMLKHLYGYKNKLKGKQNVLPEVNLIMICYNLTRLMSILNPKDLKKRQKQLGLELSRLFGTISAILGPFLFQSNLFYGQKTIHKTHITSL